jgi:hypothetical protein
VSDSPAQVAESKQPLLVFLHIPKTAGTALGNVLSLNESAERIVPIGNVFKGGGGISTRLLERLHDESRPLKFDEATILTGHFPLGVGGHLRRYAGPGRDLRFFTYLREPVDRTLSHYYQILDNPSAAERFTLTSLPPDPTVDDMLERGFLHDNVQTRMLCGLMEPFGEVTDDMFQRAKRNIREAFVFFGLAERFDESLVIAKQRLGLSTIFAGPEPERRPRSLTKAGGRVNTTRPRGDAVPAGLRRAAERCNAYDVELYRYARELFDAYPERRELECQVELAALRAARPRGDVEVTSTSPGEFSGSDQEWRMLVWARAMLLRNESSFGDVGELAEVRRQCQDALEFLGRIKEQQAAHADRYEAKLAGRRTASGAKPRKRRGDRDRARVKDTKHSVREGKRRKTGPPIPGADTE